MPGPDATRLPFRSASDLYGLSFAHEELVEHVLRVARVGAEDLEQARLRDLADREHWPTPVPLALPSQRPDEHRLHHLLRAGELQRLDVDAGLLEVALLDRGEERQAGRDRPEADADLRRCLGAHDRRCDDGGQRGRGARDEAAPAARRTPVPEVAGVGIGCRLDRVGVVHQRASRTAPARAGGSRAGPSVRYAGAMPGVVRPGRPRGVERRRTAAERGTGAPAADRTGTRQRRRSAKKRSISRVASMPAGSVWLPLASPPAHA